MGDAQRLPHDELIRNAREAFDAGTDFTVAVEEEFALLDPATLDLVNRFEEVQAAAQPTPLREHLVGELIASEVEIKTGRRESFADVPAVMAERRAQLQELVEPMGIALGATGTHPWADWKEQRIIDTPHYRRNDELLRYVVWRNNTFGLHVHVGIRGADRAIAVVNGLRGLLPELLALSSSSPFVEGVNSGLHSARTQIFTRFFPRCGVPDAFPRGGRSTRSTSASCTTPARSPSTPSSGGASGRTSPSRPSRSGSATASPSWRRRRRSPRSPSRWRPGSRVRTTRASRCPTGRTG